MSAIGGVIDLEPGPGEKLHSTLHRMGEAMRHRGPGEPGIYWESGLGLFHRGMGIVGSGKASQPLANENGAIIAVCSGEFFDALEQRAWLEGRGHRFRTASDGEILVHLYEEFGERMMEHLKGQFAFALWDRRERALFLARDRLGALPLHWAERNSRLYFASEVKGLLACGEIAAELDPRGLDHLFTFFAQPGRRTCFAGISALLPGTFVKWNPGEQGPRKRQERRYWDMSFPDRGEELDPGEGPLLEEFGARLEHAIRLRLRADAPVVSYLSGGLDSTTVMALATRETGDSLPAFSIRIPQPDLDEMSEAREVAAQLGVEPTVVTCGEDVIADSYPQLVEAAEAPVVVSSCGALLNLSRAVRDQGYRVALTGEGADEILAGYPWLKIHKALGLFDRGTFRPSNLLRYAAMKVATPGRKWKEANRYQELIGGPKGMADFYRLYAVSRHRFFSPAMWERLEDGIAYEDLDLNLEAMKRWHPLNQSLYFGCKTMLPGLLLNQKGDRVAMRHGVETRYPFLDEDLISFCSRIHPRWKLKGMTRDKHLLRRYASSFLPERITERTKKVFRAPFASGFFRHPPRFATQLLSRESLATTGLFDADRVDWMRERYVAGKVGGLQRPFVEMGLTAVMASQLWHHQYLGGGLCELPTWSPPSSCGDERARLTAMTALTPKPV